MSETSIVCPKMKNLLSSPPGIPKACLAFLSVNRSAMISSSCANSTAPSPVAFVLSILAVTEAYKFGYYMSVHPIAKSYTECTLKEYIL